MCLMLVDCLFSKTCFRNKIMILNELGLNSYTAFKLFIYDIFGLKTL